VDFQSVDLERASKQRRSRQARPYDDVQLPQQPQSEDAIRTAQEPRCRFKEDREPSRFPHQFAADTFASTQHIEAKLQYCAVIELSILRKSFSQSNFSIIKTTASDLELKRTWLIRVGEGEQDLVDLSVM
jgi:hypothetical protein